MNDQDAQEQQALIDDIINHLTGGAPPHMRITVDLEREIIRIAPLESSGVETDFTYTVNCAGTCQMTFELAMRRRDYDLWRSRTVVIQRCFPYLTPPFRELLITGLCPACWREMFRKPEVNENAEEVATLDEPPNSSPKSDSVPSEPASPPAPSRPLVLNRTVILFKGERLALFHISQDENAIRIVAYEADRRQPSVRIFKNAGPERQKAQQQFHLALTLSLRRGWKIGYDGQPLFG